MSYPFQKIEKKWQAFWEKNKFYQAKDFDKKPKKYILIEFPYPSGDGLHVGHVRSYSALDAVSRKKRMEGFNVLYPIGWDAFGLPTENYAIKKGIHPSIVTKRNIAIFKKQLKSLGLSFDWSREINTTDPEYYKWTQWIFLQFFKHGLAYQAEMPINWCPSCKIGLANEEVIDDKCERCGAGTEKRKIKQWLLRITKYADRLLKDLDTVDYLEKIKIQQQNWIGKSEGATIKFPILMTSDVINIEIFTTRVDTIFGVTAIVIAPDHPLVDKLSVKDRDEVKKYIGIAAKKSDIERTEAEKEKTGIFTGSYCLNPANGEKIPIWVGDYVVAAYGGGAVMMVPAHDKRDYQFAKKYNLEIKEVVSGGNIDSEAYVDYGVLINSGRFNGLKSEEAIKKIIEWLEKKDSGKMTIQYKMRDWIFSRQHYWGEPIPIIHCEKCGTVPVPEKDLPVKLPFVKKYEPSKTGESPLAAITEWVNTKCPKCGGPAKRETDTMPNWAGSSWYFLRYIDPKNKKSFADFKKLQYWTPVDLYNGGMEHTTLHLLYSRFWHKFLYDIKLVPTPEPYAARRSHGMVLAEDGRKMSKSFGNVINPDEIVKNFGADTLRMYEMFMGPFDQMISWNTQGVVGLFRFLNRIWQLKEKIKIGKKISYPAEPETLLHKSIKKISEDLDDMKFNTAVSQLMILANNLEAREKLPISVYETFLKLLAPLSPHIAEELWQQLGHKKSIHLEKWPEYNSRLIKEEQFDLVIQINGKFRDKISVSQGITKEEATELSASQEKTQNWLKDKKVIKTIFVPGKLINFVTDDTSFET
ncbi:MAG: leucine--tRNA ligase [Patescibacteria group bacterium]